MEGSEGLLIQVYRTLIALKPHDAEVTDGMAGLPKMNVATTVAEALSVPTSQVNKALAALKNAGVYRSSRGPGPKFVRVGATEQVAAAEADFKSSSPGRGSTATRKSTTKKSSTSSGSRKKSTSKKRSSTKKRATSKKRSASKRQRARKNPETTVPVDHTLVGINTPQAVELFETMSTKLLEQADAIEQQKREIAQKDEELEQLRSQPPAFIVLNPQLAGILGKSG